MKSCCWQKETLQLEFLRDIIYRKKLLNGIDQKLSCIQAGAKSASTPGTVLHPTEAGLCGVKVKGDMWPRMQDCFFSKLDALQAFWWVPLWITSTRTFDRTLWTLITENTWKWSFQEQGGSWSTDKRYYRESKIRSKWSWKSVQSGI